MSVWEHEEGYFSHQSCLFELEGDILVLGKGLGLISYSLYIVMVEQVGWAGRGRGGLVGGAQGSGCETVGRYSWTPTDMSVGLPNFL